MLQEKIDKANKNVDQGELGLEMAQGKANDIKSDISTIEANLAQESAFTMQRVQEELKKDKPIPDDGAAAKMMHKKINFIEKKLNSIKELQKYCQLESNNELLDSSFQKMKTLVVSTEKGINELNDKIKEKQKKAEDTGAVSDADWNKQMNFVIGGEHKEEEDKD